MSPRAVQRMKPKPPPCDKQYRDGWNDGYEAGVKFAETKANWEACVASAKPARSKRR